MYKDSHFFPLNILTMLLHFLLVQNIAVKNLMTVEFSFPCKSCVLFFQLNVFFFPFSLKSSNFTRPCLAISYSGPIFSGVLCALSQYIVLFFYFREVFSNYSLQQLFCSFDWVFFFGKKISFVCLQYLSLSLEFFFFLITKKLFRDNF